MTAVFMIAGPLLGTFVYTRFGVETSLAALVAVFASASLAQLLLPASPRKRDGGEKTSPIADLREGFGYVAGHRTLKTAAVMFLLIGLSAGIVAPLDVFVVMERLGLEKEAVQWFAMLEGVGLLVGGGLAAGLSGRVDRHRKRIVPWTLAVFGIGTFVEVLSQWPVLTGVVRLLSGVAMTFLQVVLGALMIKEVEEAYVGRTNGIILPLMMGGLLVGTGLSGQLVQQATLFGAYGLAAALLLLCALVGARLRHAAPAFSPSAGGGAAEGQRPA